MADERIDLAKLFEFIREVSAQSQAIAEVQRDTLVQLEANTKALIEATAVIRETRRDVLTIKKKASGLKRRLRKGWRRLKAGSACYKHKQTASRTNSTRDY